MKTILDSIASYVIGAGLVVYSGVLANADAILTLGGLVLLGCRLYVDGGKAYNTYRKNKKQRRGLRLPKVKD